MAHCAAASLPSVCSEVAVTARIRGLMHEVIGAFQSFGASVPRLVA